MRARPWKSLRASAENMVCTALTMKFCSCRVSTTSVFHTMPWSFGCGEEEVCHAQMATEICHWKADVILVFNFGNFILLATGCPSYRIPPENIAISALHCKVDPCGGAGGHPSKHMTTKRRRLLIVFSSRRRPTSWLRQIDAKTRRCISVRSATSNWDCELVNN